MILTDVSLIDATMSDTNAIDVAENQRIGRMCLNFIASKLNEKGYAVDRTLLTSVGLLVDRHRVFRLTGGDDKTYASAPFYVHRAFIGDTLAIRLLAALYNALISYEKDHDSIMTIPAAEYVGKALGGGTLIVVLVGGFNVPASRQFGLTKVPPNLAMQKIAHQEISQCSLLFYMIDAQTGAIVWDDKEFKRGGTIYPEKILRMAEDIIDSLP